MVFLHGTRSDPTCSGHCTLPLAKRQALGGVTDPVHKIKFWGRLDALDALAKHLGLLKDQMEVARLEALFARLDARRARNAARKKP
jgi:hypothetical protein